MHIPPKRRQRVLRVHFLSQRGHSQRKIAEQLNISKATVRSDLQLVETHWASIAALAADDLLLQSLKLLEIRLSIAIDVQELSEFGERLSPVEYLRARDAQETRLTALAREIRRTVQDVHRRAAQRPDQPDLYDQEPQERAETTPELSKTDHPNSTISSPEQEIVISDASEEKIPANPVRPPVKLPRPTRQHPNPTPVHAAAAAAGG